ncbi:hypothetical protein ACIRST_33430 [Kitasatospora sp. NPDC101447]|uniref:hypothetical protein n=1 Tax=Kitasatospora sp. NPDC101447 TaxID=3364102 RepID=UPI003805376B
MALRLATGLLTSAQLPPGFELLPGVPGSPAPRAPLMSMPCSDLVTDSFLATHTQPLEEVSAGLERPPTGADGLADGWYGEETLDRYGPGQAAAVMTAIRGAAQRCASYSDVLPLDGPATHNTVSAKDPGVPADEGLVLRITVTASDDAQPWVTERAFVREGDVLLTVDKLIEQAPVVGVEAVLPAAVTAYRAGSGR